MLSRIAAWLAAAPPRRRRGSTAGARPVMSRAARTQRVVLNRFFSRKLQPAHPPRTKGRSTPRAAAPPRRQPRRAAATKIAPDYSSREKKPTPRAGHRPLDERGTRGVPPLPRHLRPRVEEGVGAHHDADGGADPVARAEARRPRGYFPEESRRRRGCPRGYSVGRGDAARIFRGDESRRRRADLPRRRVAAPPRPRRG